MTRIACLQMAPQLGAVDANRAAIDDLVAGAASAGAQVVVLPELASSGYVFTDRDEALAAAEPADGPTLQRWTASARRHDLVVVGGFCERAGDVLYNSAAVVDRDGVRAVYRKAHLWDRERLLFTPGDQPPPVIDTRHGRIGVLICYDLEFPEWVRLPALAGAQLLCAPVNWPWAPRPAGERPGEVVRVQADAAVNRMAIAACDRTGAERGVEWVRGSVIVDADGWPLAGPDPDATTLLADVDLAASDVKLISELSDVHADRRPELYG